jgi:hypothetical protein
MSVNNSQEKESIGHGLKEKADCIYERLRSQVTRLGSATGGATSTSHIFFIFGASVCLID